MKEKLYLINVWCNPSKSGWIQWSSHETLEITKTINGASKFDYGNICRYWLEQIKIKFNPEVISIMETRNEET